MTNMEALLIQNGSYIDASKDEMMDEYGSIEDYIAEGLGFSNREIQQLRAELLE